MPPKEIHEDFIETHGKESPSYSTVTIWAAGFKGGERALRMMDCLPAPKMSLLMQCQGRDTLDISDRRRDLQSIASEMSIGFGAVQSIQYVKGFSKLGAMNVDR